MIIDLDATIVAREAADEQEILAIETAYEGRLPDLPGFPSVPGGRLIPPSLGARPGK